MGSVFKSISSKVMCYCDTCVDWIVDFSMHCNPFVIKMDAQIWWLTCFICYILLTVVLISEHLFFYRIIGYLRTLTVISKIADSHLCVDSIADCLRPLATWPLMWNCLEQNRHVPPSVTDHIFLLVNCRSNWLARFGLIGQPSCREASRIMNSQLSASLACLSVFFCVNIALVA